MLIDWAFELTERKLREAATKTIQDSLAASQKRQTPLALTPHNKELALESRFSPLVLSRECAKAPMGEFPPNPTLNPAPNQCGSYENLLVEKQLRTDGGAGTLSSAAYTPGDKFPRRLFSAGRMDSQGAKTMTANWSTFEEVRKELGARIRALRKEKGLTGVQFARACGIRYPYLISIERGQSEIQIKELLAIAESLQTTVAELVDGVC